MDAVARSVPRWVWALFLPAIVLLLLEGALRLGKEANPDAGIYVLVPPPSIVLREVFSLASDSEFILRGVQTVGCAGIGLALGLCLGLLVGSLMGTSRLLESTLGPTLHFLRSLPAVLYVPVALIFWGADIRMPIVLSALVAGLYSAVPVSRAVAEFDREKVLFLRTRKYRRLSIVMMFILPEIISALLTALSISITLSLAVTVVAEMLLPDLG